MSVYKLSYFNLRARAEVARLLFAVAGKEYEDYRIDRTNEWPSLKSSTPLGNVPLLTVNGKVIPQSRAIERYLAREFGLYGKNNWENTMCDVVIEAINDVRPEVRTYFLEKDESRKIELSKHLAEVTLPKFTNFIETTLKDNGGQYLVGNELSLADLAVFDVIQQISIMWGNAIMDYSVDVKHHYERVMEVPRVKSWLENRPKTDR